MSPPESQLARIKKLKHLERSRLFARWHINDATRPGLQWRRTQCKISGSEGGLEQLEHGGVIYKIQKGT